MGFMDKAKKLAEQAQQKLDEAQQQFNKGGSAGQADQGGGVRYDEHGRPTPDAPPAATTPAPSAEPGQAAPVPDPAAPPEGTEGAAPPVEPAPEQAPPPPAEPSKGSGDADTSPDPFKPLE
jgi:hypothetical protein